MYRAQLEAREPFGPIDFVRIENGNPFWIRTVGVPRFDEAGQFIGYRGVGFDISTEVRAREQKRAAEAALDARQKELERSNRELLEFAQIASHDLQEPLRKIETFGARLKGRFGASLPEDGQMYLERMTDSARRMRNLITALLDYSRCGHRDKRSAVDLHDIVDQVRSNLHVRIEENRAIIRTRALPVIEANETQMYQLFQNLISNAIKFRKNNADPVVEINHTSADCPHPDGATVITVTDNGIGFDPARAEKLFGMFQRLHGRSEYEGHGVGLAICRKIVEAHGGTISADARPTEGATFTIRFPWSAAVKRPSPSGFSDPAS
jgi:light-regulated signal transduction histidine kinase (bacteriophytochrome)